MGRNYKSRYFIDEKKGGHIIIITYNIDDQWNILKARIGFQTEDIKRKIYKEMDKFIQINTSDDFLIKSHIRGNISAVLDGVEFLICNGEQNKKQYFQGEKQKIYTQAVHLFKGMGDFVDIPITHKVYIITRN